MPGLVAKLDEQLADLRSNQIAYRLTIENHGSSPVRLVSVDARIPPGASLSKITDTSLAETNARRADLLEELTELLSQYLWVTSSDFRDAWIDNQKEALKRIFSVTGILRTYFEMFSGNFQARMKREFETLRFRVYSSVDARNAISKWMGNPDGHGVIKSLFTAKTEQLESLESRMSDSERSGLTTIYPDSFFASTYVFDFKRYFLEPRKYQFAIDSSYVDPQLSAGPNPPVQNLSVSTGLQISPYPFCLSVVAVVSALLGAFVQLSIGADTAPFNAYMQLTRSGQILVGPILALIFFNVYEYTAPGKSLDMSVSWRSAMLIGALCGLAQDRILDALKAFLGA